jgi:hypothetical protein
MSAVRQCVPGIVLLSELEEQNPTLYTCCTAMVLLSKHHTPHYTAQTKLLKLGQTYEALLKKKGKAIPVIGYRGP